MTVSRNLGSALWVARKCFVVGLIVEEIGWINCPTHRSCAACMPVVAGDRRLSTLVCETLARSMFRGWARSLTVSVACARGTLPIVLSVLCLAYCRVACLSPARDWPLSPKTTANAFLFFFQFCFHSGESSRFPASTRMRRGFRRE